MGRFPHGERPLFVSVRNRAQMRKFLEADFIRNQSRSYGRKVKVRMKNNKQHNKLPPRARCLTPRKAEDLYGFSRRALKRAWQDRRLPIYKLGHRSVLIDVRDLESFLARCRVDALRV